MYPEEIALSIFVDFVVFPAFRIHEEVIHGNPGVSFKSWKLIVFVFGNKIPLLVIEHFSFT